MDIDVRIYDTDKILNVIFRYGLMYIMWNRRNIERTLWMEMKTIDRPTITTTTITTTTTIISQLHGLYR
jgi:hypothetical protein